MTTTGRPEAIARLRSHFIAIDPSRHIQLWDDLYKEGFIPWDRGCPNPALIDLLIERKDLLPSFRPETILKALVPGVSGFGNTSLDLQISSRVQYSRNCLGADSAFLVLDLF
jgi:hypothetical protein